jgi:hypothetical protein
VTNVQLMPVEAMLEYRLTSEYTFTQSCYLILWKPCKSIHTNATRSVISFDIPEVMQKVAISLQSCSAMPFDIAMVRLSPRQL